MLHWSHFVLIIVSFNGDFDMLDGEKASKLIEIAKNARKCAYAPYSDFAVGAAVLGASGAVYIGCNVENASYGLTMCAERVAVFNAIASGERTIAAVAVISGNDEIVRPCGACLQVLSEFSLHDSPVNIVAGSASGDFDIKTINDYLPARFTLK